ncbi:LysR family transcriptional regulator [Raoultibacter phocaeensis]|uniref:LysR family transcriptional regulator n=1 Tax=Raoultibacter phocaeensis TaxID=2479841 RepID=UPI002104CB73|nr:LysR family transcriptional regulator [Raoultibacter phocaeensis]
MIDTKRLLGGTVEIRQIDYFVAVAQRKSFTKAADELYLSRQALSKAVRNLEHELGAKLLANREHHLELTEFGTDFLNDAAPVLQAYKELEQRYTVASGEAPLTYALSVAFSHGTALSLPERTVDAFRAKHPEIMLSAEEVTTEEAIGMIRSGESDISLVGSAPRYLSEFDIALVVETGVFVHVPIGDALASRDRLSLADLDGKPFITFGKRNHLHRYFMEACEAADVCPTILMTTSDVDLLVRSADEQQAFYFGFPPNVLEDEKEQRVLIAVDMGRDDAFGTYAIKRKGSVLSSSARAFWDYLGQL